MRNPVRCHCTEPFAQATTLHDSSSDSYRKVNFSSSNIPKKLLSCSIGYLLIPDLKSYLLDFTTTCCYLWFRSDRYLYFHSLWFVNFKTGNVPSIKPQAVTATIPLSIFPNFPRLLDSHNLFFSSPVSSITKNLFSFQFCIKDSLWAARLTKGFCESDATTVHFLNPSLWQFLVESYV